MQKNEQFSFSNFKNTGLSQVVAKSYLEQFGANKVIGKKPPGNFYFLFKQFQNPLVLVLVIAVIITTIIGDFTDALVIALAVFINTMLGFIQERKAFKSLESLKNVVTQETYVIRDGERSKVAVSTIVPGDIAVVYQGDKIPADGLVIENTDLLIEEAILTGESIPVEKQITLIPQDIHSLEELLSKESLQLTQVKAIHKVFMGTIVTGGHAKILITKTGMDTQLGSIASQIEENRQTKTPLEKKLDALARLISVIVILLSILIFIIGVLTYRDPVEMFTTAVAIAVAAIPEGLVVGLTAILAIGMHKILKRKGLVRTLVAAETLGSVTTVCIDKTGTLTEGKMKVSKTESSDETLLYRASTLANERKDPIEIARWNWAQEYSEQNKKITNPEQLQNQHPRDGEIPFSVERRFFAVQVKHEVFLAGAPEEMLERSSISSQEKKRYLDMIADWSSQGKRLIGYGYIAEKNEKLAHQSLLKLKGDKSTQKVEWIGLMAFDDPVRKDVKSVIEKTQTAGITIKVITGDYSSTALSVMKQIGIAVLPSQVMDGAQVEALSIKELEKKLPETILFARTKPAHKLKIVQALKNVGEIVGMMGDGVNDAPALALSDIGIVVENASEVAKESSDLVLLDSNMNTIIAAIEEGRAMFDNLRKVTLYLLSDSFAELILVLVSIMAGTPLAITAAQILWINLIDDGLPNLALTIDPKSPDLLQRKPLSPKTHLINKEMFLLIFIISSTAAFTSFIVFKIYLEKYGLELAQTMVFAILSIDSLLYVYSCRSLEKNIWHESLLNNKALLLATGVGFILTILSIYLKPLQILLGTVALTLDELLVVGVVSIFVIVIIELFKWLWNKKFYLLPKS